MAHHPAGTTLLILAAAALAACGGSGSDDAATTETIDTSPVAISDDPASTGVSGDTTSTADSDDGASTASTINGSNTDAGSSFGTVVSDESSTSTDNATVVCGTIENSFSYDLLVNEFNGREGGLVISSPVTGYGWDGNAFCDMDNSVGVTGIAVLIPQIESAPVIDGISEFYDPDWVNSAWTGIIDNVTDENITSNLLESSVPGYTDGARPGDWYAAHDNESLYIRYLVRNERSSTGNNQVFRDSTDARDDDSIDIYIDGDNSKGTSYDGINDFHTTVAFLDSDTQFHLGPNSATTLQLDFSAGEEPNSFLFGWYELKINLESAGIIVGQPFGFEIQLNEDDNGGARDAKFGWFEPSGSTVADSNPSVFGTVLLTGCADQSAGSIFCGTDQLLNPAL